MFLIFSCSSALQSSNWFFNRCDLFTDYYSYKFNRDIFELASLRNVSIWLIFPLMFFSEFIFSCNSILLLSNWSLNKFSVLKDSFKFKVSLDMLLFAYLDWTYIWLMLVLILLECLIFSSSSELHEFSWFFKTLDLL